MSLFKNVNTICYIVKDWERAKKFYANVLDWPLAWSSEDLGWYEYGADDETHIAINRWNGPGDIPPKEGGAIAVLTVKDARAAVTALRVKGVVCDDPVEIPGVVVYSTFYDPDGNRIQFASTLAS